MKWDAALVDMIAIAKEGKLEGKEYMVGFDSPDAAGIGSYGPSVPEDVRKDVAQIIEDIKSGKLNPAAK